MNYTATYSPEDNKLRLYASSRLSEDLYKRVREAGFIWAPKQDLFVSPMWTPSREDLLLELAGEIGDEDTSLVQRATERAERFGEYSESRAEDAERAHKAVSAIADNIPLGQPILIGHHSEKHARKDAERIENGMRKAVRMWETSEYWKSRAVGAIRVAKYKELPAVRARRIRTIEADKRKREREKTDLERLLRLWSVANPSRERALAIANTEHLGVKLADGSTCWSGWSALNDNKITPEEVQRQRLEDLPRYIAYRDRWILHYSNRLEYERAMLAESGGTVAERTKPEVGGGCRCWASPRGGWSYIQKVNRVSVTVLDNWGNGGANFTRTIAFDKLSGVMTRAQVEQARASGQLHESADKTGFFVVVPEPAKPETQERFASESAKPSAVFDAMREQLRNGVQVVTAPQLFPTPPELAARIVEIADIPIGARVLEPSAGTGNILRAVQAAVFDVELQAVELNPKLAEALEKIPGVHVHCRDFMETNGDLGKFDRVLMNPPFSERQDILHILHAMTFLKPSGRLVAICANGPRQAQHLRPLVEKCGGMWEELPDDTFKDSGTSVRTVLVVVDKPEAIA